MIEEGHLDAVLARMRRGGAWGSLRRIRVEATEDEFRRDFNAKRSARVEESLLETMEDPRECDAAYRTKMLGAPEEAQVVAEEVSEKYGVEVKYVEETFRDIVIVRSSGFRNGKAESNPSPFELEGPSSPNKSIMHPE